MIAYCKLPDLLRSRRARHIAFHRHLLMNRVRARVIFSTNYIDQDSNLSSAGQKNQVEPKHEGDDETNEAVKDEETGINGPSLFKVKGPYLPEFNYLYLKEMKRRAKERKKEKDLRQNKRKSLAPTQGIFVFVSLHTCTHLIYRAGDVELAVEYVEEPEVIDAIEKIASNAGQLEVTYVLTVRRCGYTHTLNVSCSQVMYKQRLHQRQAYPFLGLAMMPTFPATRKIWDGTLSPWLSMKMRFIEMLRSLTLMVGHKCIATNPTLCISRRICLQS